MHTQRPDIHAPPAPSLSLSGFGVAFASRRVLGSIDLELGRTGLTALMGPGGTGKSTLARTLCGANDSIKYMRTWGTARFMGAPISPGHRPALITQRLAVVEHTAAHWLADALPGRGELTRLEQLDVLEDALAEHGWREHARWLETPTLDVPTSTMRRFAIVRELLGDPPLLCVDEPTHGLEDEDADDILLALKRVAMTRAVLWITHHQARAARFGEHVALLLDGVVWERGPASIFFAQPRTPEGASFIRTGGCSPPARPELVELEEASEPAAPAAHEPTPEAPPNPAARTRHPIDGLYARPDHYVRGSVGPRGFRWLVPGVLGGSPQPGLLRDFAFDSDALRRVGTDHLITLTELALPGAEELDPSVSLEHFPMPDMGAPSCADAAAMCARVDARLARGEAVVFHCKAGHGRTGTMLAAHMIWRGLSAEVAVAEARRVERKWIQSDAQIDFLHRFESWRTRRGEEHPHEADSPHTNQGA
jgi:atypical dual specificity phosphatase